MALIKIVESQDVADFQVYLVGARLLADLTVHVVESRDAARGHDELWCFVESCEISTSKMHFVESPDVADLQVCFIESRSAAGWQITHDLVAKLG